MMTPNGLMVSVCHTAPASLQPRPADPTIHDFHCDACGQHCEVEIEHPGERHVFVTSETEADLLMGTHN